MESENICHIGLTIKLVAGVRCTNKTPLGFQCWLNHDRMLTFWLSRSLTNEIHSSLHKLGFYNMFGVWLSREFSKIRKLLPHRSYFRNGLKAQLYFLWWLNHDCLKIYFNYSHPNVQHVRFLLYLTNILIQHWFFIESEIAAK